MYQEAKNVYHLFQASLAKRIYRVPASDLKIIGVTGTDGKTTTATLIYHILSESGRKAALISTVAAYIGDTVYDTGFHVTTPSPFLLQKYFKEAKARGISYVVLEVTSHALHQNRVAGIPFEIGVITNVSREHLDYHKTYDNYLDAKMRLLKNSKKTVVNMDDPSFFRIEKEIPGKIISYSLEKSEADVNLSNFKFKTSLIGNFNKANILAAAATAEALGVEKEKIVKAIATFAAPIGRQEVVFDREFTVMVDFAHTPNAFAQLLSEISKNKNGRLIHVFGSAGSRDAAKRPFMGEESSRYADVIILTAEDSRDENIDDINSDIQAGIDKNFIEVDKEDFSKSSSNKKILKINDRKEAIEFAINMAKKGDFVLLTGKGHEKSINYGKGEEPWDEFEEVRKTLKAKGV